MKLKEQMAALWTTTPEASSLDSPTCMKAYLAGFEAAKKAVIDLFSGEAPCIIEAVQIVLSIGEENVE